MSLSCCSIISVLLVFFINLYHCTSSLLILLFNTQVNVVDLPSHTVTSSGSLITAVDVIIFYVHAIISPIITLNFKAHDYLANKALQSGTQS